MVDEQKKNPYIERIHELERQVEKDPELGPELKELRQKSDDWTLKVLNEKVNAIKVGQETVSDVKSVSLMYKEAVAQYRQIVALMEENKALKKRLRDRIKESRG